MLFSPNYPLVILLCLVLLADLRMQFCIGQLIFQQGQPLPGAAVAAPYCVVMSGQLYFLGGQNAMSTPVADAYASPNADVWWTTQAAFPSAAFEGPMATWNGNLLVIGGLYSSGAFNDIYVSEDLGNSWSMACTTGPWSSRYGHEVTPFITPSGQAQLVLTGGYAGGYTNDVWFCTDPGNSVWQLYTASAPWSGRYYHNVVSFSGQTQLVLVAGNTGGWARDVWLGYFPANGNLQWLILTGGAPFGMRGSAGLVNINEHLYLIGGTDGVGNGFNDVWRSGDGGQSWQEVTNGTSGFPDLSAMCAVAVGNQIVLAGGQGSFVSYPFYNDIWTVFPE